MKNDLLVLLDDLKERKFPVIYKHCVKVDSLVDIDDIHNRKVFISEEKDAKVTCLKFYKPISKLL